MDSKPFFITTPIYYINSTPHVGHAYTQIAADARARFERLRGREVYFLTGTDENALKVARAAQAQGRDPLEFCDELAGAFQDVWKALDISYDDFIRTTQERHRKPVREVVQRLWDEGFLELGKYSGWYSVPDETFFREEEVEERDGEHYLISPTEDQTKAPLEWTEEVGHFFKLSNFGDRLLQIYVANPAWVRPETRRNEMLRFIEGGLFDTSISRAQDWGIPLPDGVPESNGKVIYVWFPDALLNYATAPGYLADEERFKSIWPPDLHLMSKDITRFHAILWPSLLIALGLELPREVFSHGFWTVNGKKIAKRDPETVVEPIAFATQIAQSAGENELRVGVDALRYYSLREVTFGADGDFSTLGCVARYNADLANGLGNLVQRDVVMIQKYFNSRVPAVKNDDGVWLEDLRVRQLKVEAAYETLDFSGALAQIWEVVGMANRWIEDEKPWAKVKEGDLDSVARLLNRLLVVSQWAAVCTFPAMPSSAARLWEALGRSEPMSWSSATAPFEAGHEIPAPSPIFPRADLKKFEQIEQAALLQARERESKQTMQNQTEFSAIGTTEVPTDAQIEAIAPASAPTPEAETPEQALISIDDFAKVQLRVGKVLEAERIPKADKLLRLQVDLGDEKRQILAGIAQHYTPDEMIGRSVVIVANLAPRTMRGYESQGMLLAASDDAGVLSLVNPGEVAPGGGVR